MFWFFAGQCSPCSNCPHWRQQRYEWLVFQRIVGEHAAYRDGAHEASGARAGRRAHQELPPDRNQWRHARWVIASRFMTSNVSEWWHRDIKLAALGTGNECKASTEAFLVWTASKNLRVDSQLVRTMYAQSCTSDRLTPADPLTSATQHVLWRLLWCCEQAWWSLQYYPYALF